MATKYYTLGKDNLTGTAGNDFFIAEQNLAQNTLQTQDSVSGGEGWDTLDADLLAGETIGINATGVEKLKLHMDQIGQTATLDLALAPDIEKIKIEDSVGTFDLKNTGDITDFVFAGYNSGGTIIRNAQASAVNFRFQQDELHHENYRIDFTNQETEELNFSLRNYNVDFALWGSSDLKSVSIESVGENSLELHKIQQGSDTIENVTLSGNEGGELKVELHDTALKSFQGGGANGYNGDLTMTLYSKANANSLIQTGVGDDRITIKGDLENGTTIRSGQGSDHIIIDGWVRDHVTIATGALPGKDEIFTMHAVGDYFTVMMEEGEDKLEVGIDWSYVGDHAYIHMGKGKDTIHTAGFGEYSTILTGAGEDKVYIGGLGNRSYLATGADDDRIVIDGMVPKSVHLTDHQKIEMKDGNDIIHIDGYIGGETYISLGEGDDVLTLSADMDGDSTINAGAGRDDIRIDGNVIMASILLEAGDDRITIGGNVGNSSDTAIDGGAGIDTIRLSASTANAYASGYETIGAEHFEKLIIDEEKEKDSNQIFNVQNLGNIQDVTIVGNLEGVERLEGLENGAKVTLDYNNAGKLQVAFADHAGGGNETLHFVSRHASSASSNLGLSNEVDTLTIEARDRVHDSDTHQLDLDGTAALDTISVSGNAFLDLTYGSTELEASTLTSTNTGGVTVSLTKPNIGGGSDKHVVTGSGDDVITTTDGRDSISAGDGDNTITSGLGGDTITTGVGNDTIYAGKGHDTIISGEGKDAIYAGVGNDKIYAGKGGDTIEGKVGNDEIHAGLGMDRVSGGEDGDTIYLGDDDKKDTLVYSSLDDSKGSSATTRDTVYDFGSGEDQIDLTGVVGTVTYVGEFTSQAALESAIENGGAGSAGLLKGSSVLYVSVDGDGDLSDDMQIELVGVNDMAQGDFV